MENNVVFSLVSEKCTVNTLIALRCTCVTINSYYNCELVCYLRARYRLTKTATFRELVREYDQEVLDVVRSPVFVRASVLIPKCIEQDNVEVFRAAMNKYNLDLVSLDMIIFSYAIYNKSYNMALHCVDDIIDAVSSIGIEDDDFSVSTRTIDEFVRCVFRSCNVSIIQKLKGTCYKLIRCILDPRTDFNVLMRYSSYTYLHYLLTGDKAPHDEWSFPFKPTLENIVQVTRNVDLVKFIKDNGLQCDIDSWTVDNHAVEYLKNNITYEVAKWWEEEYNCKLTANVLNAMARLLQ